jgi:hypothetical protein
MGDVIEALRAGAVDYLRKPFSVTELASAVERGNGPAAALKRLSGAAAHHPGEEAEERPATADEAGPEHRRRHVTAASGQDVAVAQDDEGNPHGRHRHQQQARGAQPRQQDHPHQHDGGHGQAATSSTVGSSPATAGKRELLNR